MGWISRIETGRQSFRRLRAWPRPRLNVTRWRMRALVAAVALLGLNAPAARANVLIAIDKSTQQMSVSVDGVPRYRWFSKEYYNSPMPHSIFFQGGYAIHGSYEIHRLGGPASHGCIRLHPANAATLFALVRQRGMGDTVIVVSGGHRSW